MTEDLERRLRELEKGRAANAERIAGALVRLRIFAFIFLLVFSASVWKIGSVANDAQDAIDTANAERAARSATVAQVIDFGCSTDNGQDRLLAKLVAASIDPQQGAFGDGVDPNTLTPFDLQVLATIAKVSAAQPTNPLTRKFKHVLKKLRDLTDCDSLVSSYLAGAPIITQPDALDRVAHAVAHGTK